MASIHSSSAAEFPADRSIELLSGEEGHLLGHLVEQLHVDETHIPAKQGLIAKITEGVSGVLHAASLVTGRSAIPQYMREVEEEIVTLSEEEGLGDLEDDLVQLRAQIEPAFGDRSLLIFHQTLTHLRADLKEKFDSVDSRYRGLYDSLMARASEPESDSYNKEYFKYQASEAVAASLKEIVSKLQFIERRLELDATGRKEALARVKVSDDPSSTDCHAVLSLIYSDVIAFVENYAKPGDLPRFVEAERSLDSLANKFLECAGIERALHKTGLFEILEAFEKKIGADQIRFAGRDGGSFTQARALIVKWKQAISP